MAKTDKGKNTPKSPGQNLKETAQAVLAQGQMWKSNLSTVYGKEGEKSDPAIPAYLTILNQEDDKLGSELAKTPIEVRSVEDQENVVRLVEKYLERTEAVYDILLQLLESASFKNQHQQLSSALTATQGSLKGKKTMGETAPVSPVPHEEDEDEDEDEEDTLDYPKEYPAAPGMTGSTRKGIGLHALEKQFLDLIADPRVKDNTDALFHKSKKLTLQDSDIEKLIDAWRLAVNEMVKQNRKSSSKSGAKHNEFKNVAILVGTHVLIEALYDELISHTRRTGADDLAAQILSLY